MVKKARKRASAGDTAAEQGIPVLDKIAGLLALLATKEMEKEAAALKLDAIGFTSHEISALLDVNENFVRVARHRSVKRKR
ncbi:hypothetical protein ABH973_000993 [Bradyrhizobium ottawaense]